MKSSPISQHEIPPNGLKTRLAWLCLLGYVILLLHPLIGHLVETPQAQGLHSKNGISITHQAVEEQPNIDSSASIASECGLCHQAGSLAHGAAGFEIPNYIFPDRQQSEPFTPVNPATTLSGTAQPRAPPVI